MTSAITTSTWKAHTLSSGPRQTGLLPTFRWVLTILHPAPTPLLPLRNALHHLSASTGGPWLTESGLQKGWDLNSLYLSPYVHHCMYLQWQKQNTELYWRQIFASLHFPLKGMLVQCVSLVSYTKEKQQVLVFNESVGSSRQTSVKTLMPTINMKWGHTFIFLFIEITSTDTLQIAHTTVYSKWKDKEAITPKKNNSC